MKCCGKERDTPFCPQCGKLISQPAPLISLLSYLRAQEKKNLGKLEDVRKRKRGFATSPLVAEAKVETYGEVVSARKTWEKWKRWADALDAATATCHQPAKPIADYLEENATAENNFLEAARVIRGAFE